MSTVKSRKDSLVDFITHFSKEDQQIKFFSNLKWHNVFLVINVIVMIMTWLKEKMLRVDIYLFARNVDINFLY